VLLAAILAASWAAADRKKAAICCGHCRHRARGIWKRATWRHKRQARPRGDDEQRQWPGGASARVRIAPDGRELRPQGDGYPASPRINMPKKWQLLLAQIFRPLGIFVLSPPRSSRHGGGIAKVASVIAVLAQAPASWW